MMKVKKCFFRLTVRVKAGREVLCATALTLIASEGFFPARRDGTFFSVRTTSSKACTHSVLPLDKPLVFSRSSCAYWCSNILSAWVRLVSQR